MKPNQKLLEIHSNATRHYHEQLAGSPAELYLAERGLLEGADMFQLGYVGTPAPGHDDRFTGCLAIPYLTHAGTVSVKFRRLDGSQPKYDQPSGQKQHLYNVGAVLDAVAEVLIVEGELDAIAATLAGHPACAVAGANAWRPLWRRCFDGIGVVKIVTDNDLKEDGSNPGLDLARRVEDSLSNGVRVSLPAGHDVNSMIMQYGAPAFADLVEAI